MFKVDSNKCTGCGVCADICPPGAISIENSIAMIDQKLCTQCGDCAVTCPADAVYALEPALTLAEVEEDYHGASIQGWAEHR